MPLLPLLPRHRLPRPLRVLLARRSLPFWLLTAAAALATGLTVSRAVGRAGANAAATEPGPALVVTAAVAPGDRLDTSNTAMASRPKAELPVGAVTAPLRGAVALDALVPGEIVVASRLAPGGLSPAAALLPAGARGVAVPADPAALPVVVGDRVDVVAALPFDVEGPDSAASVVAPDAVVVHVGEASVVVAVAEADVPALARALAEGSVQVVLRGAT